MSSNQLSARLVAAACEIAGVREKLPADWFEAACPKCGYSLWIRGLKIGVGTCRHCRYEHRDDSDTRLPDLYIGPDLTDPRNLWALLAVCDAVGGLPANLWHNDLDDDFGCCVAGCIDTGPTRESAALAALAAALNIKVEA